MLRIIDVIEWADQGSGDIMQRVPESGQGDIRYGSQLIVRPSQVAIFIKEGKALDIFTEGRYTLDAKNLPILTTILKLGTNNKTPFPAEVYFVTTKDFIDMKWGTPGEITVRDSEFGMVQLKAFGSYSMAIKDPRSFINQIIGVQGAYSTNDVSNYLRGMLLSEIGGVFGTTMATKSLLDMAALQPALGKEIQAQTADDFDAIGINLKKVYVSGVEPSDAIKQAIAQRGALGALGVNYMQYQAGQAMRDAATNTSGGVASMGAGLGAGMGIGQVMAQAMASGMTQPTPTAQAAASPTAAPTTKAQIRDALTKLDIRLANGEISETIYTKLSTNLEKALENAAG